MYFMKQAHDAVKDRIKKVEDEVHETKKSLDAIKDSTVKKEDFREFKEELWLRLDKMEIAWEKRLGLSK